MSTGAAGAGASAAVLGVGDWAKQQVTLGKIDNIQSAIHFPIDVILSEAKNL